MNSMVEGIIIGVLANGLTALFARVGKRRNPVQAIRQSVVQRLAKTAAAVARDIVIDDAAEGAALKHFLVGADVETLVRRLYDGAYLKESKEILDATRREFQALFTLHFEDRSAPSISAEQLFDQLYEACEIALQQAIDEGELNALDAKSAVRHRTLLARLNDIQSNLDFLRTGALPSDEEINTFRRDYQAEAKGRFGYLTPPSIDQQRKVQIDDLFVQPTFRADADLDPKQERINMGALVYRIHRTIVLGSPGGGKTTFARKLVHLLASHNKARPVAGRCLTPFLVTLKDYAAEKAKSSMSVLQFIEAQINASHQIPPPAGAVELLMRTGTALVVFDGLDELLESARRKEARDDVESFCRRYPETAVLVTSREVGYPQAPLDADVFSIFRIADFAQDQVVDYAKKWFAYVGRETEADAFVEESASVPDLRENPMLLALLCTLYRGPGTLPRKRPDVYERCTKMLFEQWDRHRGIHHQVPYPNHLFWAMQHLAYWIYDDPALRGGVTERQLVAATRDYLFDRCTEDGAEAEAAARDFVAFCRGRAWVFTDTGRTADDEPVYEFTHRTFLEYFTACHLVRNHPSPDALANVLLPHIEVQEWDVVAQLAFHTLAHDQSDAADLLIERLVTRSESSDDFAWSVLYFAGRCLSFLTPRPRTVKRLTQSFMKRWLPGLADDRNKGYKLAQIARPYLSPLPENRLTVAEVFRDVLGAGIAPGASNRQRIAEIALKMDFHLQPWNLPLESYEFWKEFSRLFCEHHRALVEELARESLIVARTKPCGTRHTPAMLWKHFGFDSLYQDISSINASNHRFGSYVEWVYWNFRHWLEGPERYNEERIKMVLADAEELAPVIVKSPAPWADQGPAGLFVSTFDLVAPLPEEMEAWQLPAPTVFLMLSFFAYSIDAQLFRGSDPKPVMDRLDRMVGSDYLTEFARCALARVHGEILPPDLDQRFAAFFPTSQHLFIRRWVRGDMVLVGPGPVTNAGA